MFLQDFFYRFMRPPTMASPQLEAEILDKGAVIVQATAFLNTPVKAIILVPNDAFLVSLGWATAVPSPQKVEVRKFGSSDYYFVANDGSMLKTTAVA